MQINTELHELVLSLDEAATRQCEAAIAALQCGHFDIALTLAGAAEGMLERKGTYLFSFMRDSPKIKESEISPKEWNGSGIVREVVVLKHGNAVALVMLAGTLASPRFAYADSYCLGGIAGFMQSAEAGLQAAARCHKGDIIQIPSNGGGALVAMLCDLSKAIVSVGEMTVCMLQGGVRSKTQ